MSNISNEAVEAGIEALRTPAPNSPPEGVMSWREIALTVLEAAAPHLKCDHAD